jgi:enoyl-CoA hydratase/carnithine racemase
MSRLIPIHPEGWAPAKGYANGMLAPAGGRMLFVAGQIAWDVDQRLVGGGDFVRQFEQALRNVLAVVGAAGGRADDIARLTVYVTDKQLYLERLVEVGRAYRAVMGRHYPAMALVQVADLLEPGALVVIEASMQTPRSFRFEVQEGVGTITLDRPDVLNALTFEVYAELRDLFAALQDHADVRVVVITGAGRAFCSGGDVNDIIGALFARDMAGLLEFTRMTCDLIKNIRLLRKPVIASLNGTVAGAGAVIALASDLRIAAESAKIAFLFTRVGLSGADMGAAFLLPRVIGTARATELLMTGDFIDAREAGRLGLYNQVVPGAELAAATAAMAGKLARGPAFGLAMTKEMINREASMDLLGALEAEAQAQTLCMMHPDFREAYDAFVAKRPANFR